MKKIHHRLRQKYQWYDKWHKHPKHNFFHWLSLIAFSELAFVFVFLIAATIGRGVGPPQVLATRCARQAPLVNVQAPVTSAAAGSPLTYSITINNMDSRCGIEDFHTTITVVNPDGPVSGWIIAPAEFTAPIASQDKSGGSTTYHRDIQVVSHPLSKPQIYKIVFTVENAAKPRYNTQAGMPYEVTGDSIGGPPTGDCFHLPPELAVSNSTPASAIPGQSLGYQLKISNNDTAACPATKFNLDVSAPADTIKVKGLENPVRVGTGASDSDKTQIVDFSVDSIKTIQPGRYPFKILVISDIPQHRIPPVVGYYEVKSSLSDNDRCKRHDPQVTVLDRRKSRPAGAEATYDVTVKNTDVRCSGSNFIVGVGPIPQVIWLPQGWTATERNFALESGRELTTQISVTSPTDALPRDYPLSISSKNINSGLGGSDSAVYAVQVPDGTTPPEPTMYFIDPPHSSIQVPGDFSVTAGVIGAYKVDQILFRVDDLDIQPPQCSFTGVSFCTATILANAWSVGSSHDVIAIGRKNGQKISHPAHLTAERISNPGLPTVTLSASSTQIHGGEGVILTWQPTNAASCRGSGGSWGNSTANGTKNPNGGMETVTGISVNTTYGIVCANSVGASLEATVTVNIITGGSGGEPNGFCAPEQVPACLRLSGETASGQALTNGMVTGGDFSFSAVVYGNPNITKLKLFVDGARVYSCVAAQPVDGSSCSTQVSTEGWGKTVHTISASAINADEGLVLQSPVYTLRRK